MSSFNSFLEAFEKHTNNTGINQILQQNKTDEEVKTFLDQYNIKSVWHFTDQSNIESITKHGLLSLHKLRQQHIDVEYTGSSKESHMIDRYKGLDKYVHLSFIQDHPLYYIALNEERIIDPAWIEIDISVIFEETTLFCDKVANDNTARLFKLNKVSQKIDLDTMINHPIFDEGKEARKAEILVFDRISPDKILGVYDGDKTHFSFGW